MPEHGRGLERLELRLVTTAEEMRAALYVRRAVFIDEQGVPEHEEIDAHDGDPSSVTTAVHALARLQDRPVGAGRLLLERDEAGHAHIGRVAVLASERRRGVGRALMQLLQDEAARRGYAGITLAAQLHAIPFYKRLGYTARDGVFLDAGIEHRWMDVPL